MRKTAVIFCVLGMISGLNASAQEVEPALQELTVQLSQAMTGQVKKLAVIEFPELNGHHSSLGQFIAEELITNFSSGARSGQFDIVERRQLARVLKEQELTDSSLFDDKSIAKIGKILGIDAIVTGSIADLGPEVKVNARVISVETAKVFAAAATKFKKSDTVQQLMRQGVASPVATSDRPVSSGAVAFQDNDLRIDLVSVNMTKDKRKVTLRLVIQNLTAQEMFLAVRYRSGCDASIIDETGAQIPSPEAYYYINFDGLSCIDGGSDNQERYAKILPAAKLPVTITFRYESASFGGKLFTFRAELLRLIGNSPTRFTVSLFDVPAGG